MRRATVGLLLAGGLLAGAGCYGHRDTVIVEAPAEEPAPPRALDGWYHARAVHLSWALAPAWDGESFRVYGKRAADADYVRIAEVTSCSGGVCAYTDVNVLPGVTYHYYVAAVAGRGGAETASADAVEVFVPRPVPPAVPGGLEAVALDGAVYLRWDARARQADDFGHYRVYLVGADGGEFFLGESDSEGFLDERAENGSTYRYLVTASDDQGHESGAGTPADATPRPDFHEEWVYAYGDRPADAGFRFQAVDDRVPLVDGDDPGRHFRLEVDAGGWWLVPGPPAAVYPEAFRTTALRCGPGADAGCAEVSVAPAGGYVTGAVELLPRTTYVLRVRGADGAHRYGAVRVEMLGSDGAGDAVMVFDWAYQLQAGNRSLAPGAVAVEASAGGG